MTNFLPGIVYYVKLILYKFHQNRLNIGGDIVETRILPFEKFLHRYSSRFKNTEPISIKTVLYVKYTCRNIV